MCVRFSIWLSGCGSSWAAWLLVQTPWQPAGSGMRWRRRQMVAEMWRFQLDWRLSPQLFQRRWCFTSQTIVMISLISCVHFNLARSANLPTGLYILSSLISFFFKLSKAISGSILDRFSRSLHQMEGICVNVVNPVYFFQFLKGRCHGNQFCIVADLFARFQSINQFI